MKNYFQRREKKGDGDSWSTRDVGMIRKYLREEYFPKEVKQAAPEAIEAVAESDTKITEKFEPFYEGEEVTQESVP